MSHCWDEYLEKVHKAVPVDPWATNVQLLDVFIHERSSSAWLPAWLHTRKAPMTRVGSMLTLGVKNSHNQKDVANADSGTTFSQSNNKDGTSAGLQGSGTNVSNGDGAAAILEPVSGEVPMYNSLVIKVTSVPDMQTSIKSSTSLLASLTGGSAAIGQFDVKGSKTVDCNISGVKSRWVDMDTIMDLVTPGTSSGLPPLWHPDILLPQLQWSSKRVMKDIEKCYTSAEQMVLDLIFATQRFHSYLLPRHFVVLTIEETFPYVLQHMDILAKIAKWVIRLQEFDYTVMVEDSTRASLADVLMHRYHKKKMKKEVKPTLPPTMKVLEDAFSLYFDGAYKRKKEKASAGMAIFNPVGEKGPNVVGGDGDHVCQQY